LILILSIHSGINQSIDRYSRSNPIQSNPIPQYINCLQYLIDVIKLKDFQAKREKETERKEQRKIIYTYYIHTQKEKKQTNKLHRSYCILLIIILAVDQTSKQISPTSISHHRPHQPELEFTVKEAAQKSQKVKSQNQ
jgi:hypothetical protein